MNNVALLVFACDRYQLLYKGFDYFFKKNWDEKLQLKSYFSTEVNDIEIPGFENLKSGNGEWTNRLKRVLDQIDEEYIIFFQEDMWMSQKVKAKVLPKLLEYIISNKLDLVKLHSSEVYKTEKTSIDFNGLTLARIIKEESDFLMSHQVSVWKKEFLIEQLKDNEHPWRNERKGSKRMKRLKNELFQIDFLSENGKRPLNINKDDKLMGEYHTVSVNACLNDNCLPFIEELEDHDKDYAARLLYHYKNQITHDGKPKPRKEDPFKKIKNKIRFLLNR